MSTSPPSPLSDEPLWFQNATILHQSSSLSTNDLLLSPALKDVLTSQNINAYFPIQAAVIPAIVTAHWYKHDIVINTPTGSGKTLAYVLPMVELLRNRRTREVRGLIVLPSRDLARQVYNVCLPFCKVVGLKVEVIMGTNSYEKEQVNLVTVKNGVYASKIDILICTPGRLMDHFYTPGFTLKHIEFLVLDEVDRLLSQEYNDFFTYLPKTKYSKILCSATLSLSPSALALLALRNPLAFTYSIEKLQLPAGLIEEYCIVTERDRPFILHSLLKEESTLVFTSSIETAHRLYRLLELLGLNVLEYSSSLTQKRRTNILAKFVTSTDKPYILICSDAMARGLDISVKNVINYDCPHHLNTYVHRVGRTARAGSNGKAISLLYFSQVKFFKDMLKGSSSNLKKINEPKLLFTHFQLAIDSLGEILKMEEKLKLLPDASLTDEIRESLAKWEDLDNKNNDDDNIDDIDEEYEGNSNMDIEEKVQTEIKVDRNVSKKSKKNK